MRTMKLRAGLACLVMLFANVACNRTTQLRIAVIPKGQTHIYWQTVHAGAVKAGNEMGAQIFWNGPATENDLSNQIGIVDDFINQHVDGIALAPADGEALVPVVEHASDEHILVSIFDSGIKTDKYVRLRFHGQLQGGRDGRAAHGADSSGRRQDRHRRDRSGRRLHHGARGRF